MRCFNYGVGIPRGSPSAPCKFKHELVLTQEEKEALREKTPLTAPSALTSETESEP